jgi:medium-chain acyl-[acyl-carrier-protein] hydrolase
LSALVGQIALAIEPHLDKPFAFFGYSLGAIIAFELARCLRQRAGVEPLRLFVAACSAPQIRETREEIYNLPEPELLERLRRLNGTPTEVLEHSELIQLMLPRLRADFEMAETYTYCAAPPLRSAISAFGGLQDREVKREHLEAWRDQTTGSFNMRMFEGDHFFIHQSEPLLLDVIARELHQEERF